MLFPAEWIKLSPTTATRYSLWFCSSISYWIIKVSLWLTSLRPFYFFSFCNFYAFRLSLCLHTHHQGEHFVSHVPLSPCLSIPPSQTDEGRWSADTQRKREWAATAVKVKETQAMSERDINWQAGNWFKHDTGAVEKKNYVLRAVFFLDLRPQGEIIFGRGKQLWGLSDLTASKMSSHD